MQEPDQQYPLKQPRRHPFDDFNDDQGDQQAFIQPVEPQRTQHVPMHQREEAERPELPRGHLKTTLLIALIVGIIASVLNIVVTLVNSGVYAQAANSKYAADPTKLPVNIAITIFGLFCLTSIISAIIYFTAGFITGKIAVSRRLGFLCGFLAGAITLVIDFVVQRFPNYPGSVDSGLNGGLPGIGTGTIDRK